MVDQVVTDRFINVQDKGQTLLTQHKQSRQRMDWIEEEPFGEWRTQSLTLLRVVFGTDHVYTQDFDNSTTFDRFHGVPQPHHVQAGMGALRAAAEDYARGYTWTFKEIVHAEVFDDFLEMANYLINDGGYKDAAAVLAGGVLEEHFRKLCQRNNIPTESLGKRGLEPHRMATLIVDLRKANVYNQITWRKHEGWIDIRNSAAHRKYGDYTRADVEQMIDGLRDFISRYPA